MIGGDKWRSDADVFVGGVATVMGSATMRFMVFDMGCTTITLIIATLFFRLVNMGALGATVRMLKHEQFRLMAIIAVMQRKAQPIAEKHKEKQCAEQHEGLQ